MKKFYSLFVAIFLLFIGAGTAAAQLTIEPGTKYYLMYGDKYVCESMNFPDLTDDIASALQFTIEYDAGSYVFNCSKGYLESDEVDALKFGSLDYFDISGTNDSFDIYCSYGYITTFSSLYFEFQNTSDTNFHIVPVVGGSGDSNVITSVTTALDGGNHHHYATFYSSEAWLVPEGGRYDNVEVYVISEVDANNNLVEVKVAETGQVVPGECAVLLRTINEQTFTIKKSSETPVTITANNLLKGTDVDTPNIHADGYVYYILSKADGVPGFYYQKGCTDGSYVNNGAHKAYLRLEKTNGGSSNGFTFRFDDNLTSVQSVTTQENATIYNLQGQRVSGKAAGVYVKNGKKFIVR